jgi:hypothetical protein
VQREEEDIADQSTAFHPHEFVCSYAVLNQEVTEDGISEWTWTCSVELIMSYCNRRDPQKLRHVDGR